MVWGVGVGGREEGGIHLFPTEDQPLLDGRDALFLFYPFFDPCDLFRGGNKKRTSPNPLAKFCPPTHHTHTPKIMVRIIGVGLRRNRRREERE